MKEEAFDQCFKGKQSLTLVKYVLCVRYMLYTETLKYEWHSQKSDTKVDVNI